MNAAQILLTNDDGIGSAGLWAAAETLSKLGEVIVVAPRDQWSGAGRSFPRNVSGKIELQEKIYGGGKRTVYAVDGSPAQAVLFALLEILSSPPSLVVAGINIGENVGCGITISGTIGAVLEAAGAGLKALAVSQEAPAEGEAGFGGRMDFTAAAHFTGLFARKLLDASPERDVDAIKVDVPRGAKAETPWRLTRLSRARYYQPQRPEREALSVPAQIPYRISFDPCEAEPDSDVYALRVERKVTVTPLSLDLTSRTDLPALERILRGGG